MKEKNIIYIISLIAGSLMLEGVILIALQIFFRDCMSAEVNIITIVVAIIIASILYPYILLKKTYSVSRIDLGICYQPILSTSLLIGSIICLGRILLLQNFSKGIILIIIQNLFVAIGEEFVARACLFYLLRKIISNEKLIMLISAIIFVFVFHSNSSLIDNLVWRLPVTILLVFVYSKTNSVINCSIIHMTYNVFVSV